ncbi:hypothetical protein Tco_1149320 [Tanacetum coccineum]
MATHNRTYIAPSHTKNFFANMRVKRLYKVGRSARVVSSNEASLGDSEDASKKGRKINDIDADAEITLVDETQRRYGDERYVCWSTDLDMMKDMDTKLVEGSEVRAEGSETREESSSKRAGDELEQEKAKKQKVDEDKENG